MKLKSIRLLAAMALLWSACCAQAAITCTAPVSTGFSTAYASAGVVPNVTQGSVSFTCTRSAGGDATSLLLRANNGVNVCAGSNDASFGGTCINYEAYQNSACSTLWTGNSNATSIPVTLLSVLTPQPLSFPFWGCITVAGQAPAAGAGTYTDTVTMTVRGAGGAPTYSTGTFPVSVTYPATCSITSIQNVAFGSYVAFRSTPLVAPPANITLNCTSRLPYTMALNATSGVVVGLNYSLALDTNSSIGTGPAQIHTITGTMPANQAGTCVTGSCSGTNTHTLTITY